MIYLGSGRDGGRVELPESILTLVIAIMAKRGAGKSYAAGVLMEEFAKAGLPFVMVDPVGVHHGIRSRADGKGPGYPIPVFGAGTDADIQIGRDSGDDVARAICEENVSAIVDIHELSKTAWRIFVRDFFRTLYSINRQYGPRMILLEEATEFVPQTRRPEMNESFEAVERTIRLGRNNGLGVTLISQRAAQVAKDAFYGLDILVALRTVGTLDVKALTDMLADQLEADQLEELARFKATISGLPDGTAWLWWPKVHRFEQVVVRERETYHAGATPVLMPHSEAMVRAFTEAVPDLERLRERFKAAETFPPSPYFAGGRDPLLVANDLVRQWEERARAAEAALEEFRRRNATQGETIESLHASVDSMKIVVEQSNLDSELAAATRAMILLAASQMVDERAENIERLLEEKGMSPPVSRPKQEGLTEAEVEDIVRRLFPEGRPQMAPLPPREAIQEEFRQRAETFRTTAVGRSLDAFMEKLAAMGTTERQMFKYLVGEEAFRSRNKIAMMLFGNDGGESHKRVQAAADALLAAKMIVRGGSGRSEYKADLDGALKAALANANPTPDELEEAENAALMEMLVLN